MSTTAITAAQDICPFCQQSIVAGNLVCLTCGAQSETVEHEGPMSLAFVAIFASLGVTALSVASALGLGRALARVAMMFGAPEVVAVVVGGIGILTMLFVVPFLGWKAFMGAWKQTAERKVVWSRSGKYAGAVRVI